MQNYGNISSLTANYSFQGKKPAGNAKNAPLSFGVVNVPDKLPTRSLYQTVYENDYLKNSKPKKVNKIGDNVSKADKIAGFFGITALALSALSLLPFIRRH